MDNFWDKRYLKIVYHCVLGVALAYLALEAMKFIVYSVTDLGEFLDVVTGSIGSVVKVFLPLVIAVICAFLFEPLVEKLQGLYETVAYEKIGLKRKNTNIITADGQEFKRRNAGALGTIFVFYSFVILIVRSFILIILDGAKSVTGSSTITNQSITNYFNSAVAFLDGKIEVVQEKLVEFGLGQYAERIVEFLYSLIEGFINIISSVALNLGTLVMGISSSIILVLISTMLTFYIMRDKEVMIYKGKRFFRLFLPQGAHKAFSGLLIDVIAVFSGYIRGMLVDVTVIGIMVAVALYVIGVPYAMIIGIISGFANFIPYLGSFTAAVLAILSAALTGEVSKVIIVTIAVIVIQQIDSLVIVPKVLGDSVEISPMLVLLSLSVAGTLFGLVGMIIAVPTTALIKIFIERLIENEEQNHSVQNFYNKFKRKKSE